MKRLDFDTIRLSLGSSRICSHNLTQALPSGVSIDTVSSVADVTDDGSSTGELTISSVQKNGSSYVEGSTGQTVAAGKAVQWIVSTSSTVEKLYLLKITFVTNGSPAETIVDFVWVRFLKAE